MRQLIVDEGHRFPKAIAPLAKGTYVDDIIGGADTIEEAKDIKHQLIELCKAGCFPLQKWRSNCSELASSNLHEKELISSEQIESSPLKILGLIWRPESDTFLFTVKQTSSTEVTKRLILSEIARFFDPLGFIAPITIRAKLILQELWLLKVNWDEPLSPEICQRWTAFRQQLQELPHVAIPRWLGISNSRQGVQIHGFSDASNVAMAAVVYVRVTKEDGTVFVRLISSKTRVAPLKRLTIPRLELTAAMLLTRLITHVKNALEIQEAPLFLWTDSLVTLSWISTHPSRWKDFVRNRVISIQETAPNAMWCYVPGKQNPADCASRGMSVQQLINHNLWWKGPSWLSEPTTSWPTAKQKQSSDAELEERPGQVFSVATPPTYWDLLDRFSSLKKLLRITAWCRRFISCLRKQPNSTSNFPLTPAELEESRIFWIREVQKAWLLEEIRILGKGGVLPRSNSLVRLTPFLDRQGLLRVGGRLHFANIDPEAKHPPILPRSSSLTKLIIKEAHETTLHGGTQVTLGYIRQKHWIQGGRAPVRSFILRCVTCQRNRGRRAQQLMGQLPLTRVTQTRPFLNSGLDYAGPIPLKTWKGRAARTYKGYIAVFICMSTSAVHLELVTDYTTEAFLAAYKRFTGRRGICATLQSDNGTNFVGADVELRRRFNSDSKELKELANLLANDGTKWIFNPPSSPHFGGKWEAAVKSTKHHLTKVIGDTSLTYEELNTVLIQIEAVLNSRPLCPLSDDVTDYCALTPGHFLIGEAPNLVPEPDLVNTPMHRLTRWQLLKQRVDLFWTRWSKECLQRYLAISKWYHPTNEIKEGSLVLVTDERYPPAKWPLARVLKLHPGPDGLTRVVTLRTATTTLKRPIVKVCVLPTEPDNSTTQLSKGGECSEN